jgi:hypothetical protein
MRAFALLVGLTACVDGFKGSNIEFDFGGGMPPQASPGTMPSATQVDSAGHYALYAIEESAMESRLFDAQDFSIHPVVDLTSPCFIDVGPHVPYPGLHVSQFGAQVAKDTGIADVANPPAGATQQQQIEAATAVVRMNNVLALGAPTGLKAVTSVSASSYPAVAPDCAGEPGLIPPPTCTDPDSNLLRLTLCQAAWKADPNYYEGTDRVLTSPLNGTSDGMVDGVNPINMTTVGGAQFFVKDTLLDIQAFAVYFRLDSDPVGPGALVLFGRPEDLSTRGVVHVHMTSDTSPSLVADLAVFEDLGDDDVHF